MYVHRVESADLVQMLMCGLSIGNSARLLSTRGTWYFILVLSRAILTIISQPFALNQWIWSLVIRNAATVLVQTDLNAITHARYG